MNKKGIIIVGISFMFIISLYELKTYLNKSSYAQEVNETPQIVIECDNTGYNSKSKITCQIKGKDFDYGVSSFSSTVNIGDNLINPNYSFNNSDWQGAVDGGRIDLYTDINKTGDFVFASFTVDTADISEGANTSISLSNTIIGDSLFEEKNFTVPTLNIRIKSNINTLSNLIVSNSSISFNSETKEYSATIDSESIVITAVKGDEFEVISGDGEKTLNYGKNEFIITVTSESGLNNNYKITITRPDLFEIANDVSVEEINNVKYFKNIEENTTVSDLKNKITTSGTILVKSKDGKNILENSNLVGTGCKVNIELSNETKEYTIVISGDTNGDGQITVTDVSKIFQHYRGTITISNENEYYYILAGDVKQDSEIKLNDVSKLFQYVRKTINSLN